MKIDKMIPNLEFGLKNGRYYVENANTFIEIANKEFGMEYQDIAKYLGRGEKELRIARKNGRVTKATGEKLINLVTTLVLDQKQKFEKKYLPYVSTTTLKKELLRRKV